MVVSSCTWLFITPNGSVYLWLTRDVAALDVTSRGFVAGTAAVLPYIDHAHALGGGGCWLQVVVLFAAA